MLRIITILMLICVSMKMSASSQPKNFDKWSAISTEQLLEMGHQYSEIKNMPDSALVCYTIVSNRYRSTMSKDEKNKCARAFIGKWYIYYFVFFDYNKSYESLKKAEEICRSTNMLLPRVFLNYGVMYQTIAEQSGNKEMLIKATDNYRKGLVLAFEENDESTMNMLMGNLISVAYSTGNLSQVDSLYHQYVTRDVSKKELFVYNKYLYEGLKQMALGNNEKALAIFKKQEESLGNRKEYLRYWLVCLSNQAKALTALHRYDEALQKLKFNEQMVRQMDMKDAKLETFNSLADIYQKIGDSDKSQDYRAQGLQLKDTLLNYQQMATVGQLQFLDDIRAMDSKMEKLRSKQQMEMVVIGVIIVIALIILVSLIIVSRKNKALHKQNASLYQKTIDLLAMEDKERKMRKALEQKLGILQQPAQNFEEKYKNSNLGEEDKQMLQNAIISVMEQNEAILQADFNVDALAALVGSNAKYVSQVINEKYNRNFNNFVNEYRIREACKRFNDYQKYGGLTIEAIANSVGFRSRTSFISAFKRFTGLTPSEYQRIAKETADNGEILAD